MPETLDLARFDEVLRGRGLVDASPEVLNAGDTLGVRLEGVGAGGAGLIHLGC